MKTELVNFTKEEVHKVWSLAEPLVEQACKTNGGYNAKHILEFLEAGLMQLWMAVDKDTNAVLCCCVTEIRQYPNFKVCDLRITTGEQFVQKWKYLQDLDGNEFLKKRDLKKHTYKLRNYYEL